MGAPSLTRSLQERDSWRCLLEPGGKYYLTRDCGTIIAFAIGMAWQPGNAIGMIGTHTDSPCLRIKPISKREGEGFVQVGVETYGSGLWHSWFDRDLSIAGRVAVKTRSNTSMKLVNINRPVLRIPSPAAETSDRTTFTFSVETGLLPIAGLASAEAVWLNNSKSKMQETSTKTASEGFEPLGALSQRHHAHIINLVAEEAQCDPGDILDFELLLYDSQPACIGGLNNEFIYSARLDNLAMAYCAVEALLQSLSPPSALDSDPTIRLVACFDHEEIGSKSDHGAASQLLPAVMRRLSTLSFPPASEPDQLRDPTTVYEQTLARTFLISADMEHAAHPNHPQLTEAVHRPRMNEGTVIKINSSLNYATLPPGIVLLQECARRARRVASTGDDRDGPEKGVPLQLSVTRNDCLCGETIGPMLSASLGCPVVDVGNCQLAMHSVREVAGCDDVGYSVDLFRSFFENYGELWNMVSANGGSYTVETGGRFM